MRKKKRKISYCKAVIICHGKSEVQIVQYIKQSLRISIEEYAERNGKCGYKSIQINGLNKTLKNTIFKDIDSLQEEYSLDIVGVGKNRKINNFRIFIIMDTDDCTKEQARRFMDKSMFKRHWAYEYIIPIYNETNLEDVIRKTHIEYKKANDQELKNLYIEIFPIKNCTEKDDIEEFLQKLRKVKNTNMDELVEYCITC